MGKFLENFPWKFRCSICREKNAFQIPTITLMCGNFLGISKWRKWSVRKLWFLNHYMVQKLGYVWKNLEAFWWKNKISYTWLLSANFKTEVRKTYFSCHGTWTVQHEKMYNKLLHLETSRTKSAIISFHLAHFLISLQHIFNEKPNLWLYSYLIIYFNMSMIQHCW